jgi:hypothetical protein
VNVLTSQVELSLVGLDLLFPCVSVHALDQLFPLLLAIVFNLILFSHLLDYGQVLLAFLGGFIVQPSLRLIQKLIELLGKLPIFILLELIEKQLILIEVFHTSDHASALRLTAF